MVFFLGQKYSNHFRFMVLGIFFKNKFFNQTYIDRGQLFQELSQKGLCPQFILSEIKKSERIRQKKEKHVLSYITKQQTNLLKLRKSCLEDLSDQFVGYIKEIREVLSPYIKDVQNSQEHVALEAQKLGANLPSPTQKSA